MNVRRLLVAVAVALTAAGVGLAAPAGADAPRDQGWWTVTNPSQAAALPTALPGPPDVPSRGLLVQAGPGGMPIAFAALLWELDPGTTAGQLTLTVAPNSVTTPASKLQLCQLLQPINHPEQGGPMSDAPPYNCGKAVTASPSADGKTYQFDASGLVADGMVAVAILPTGPVDRVVFNQPDDKSLATQPGAASAGSSATDSGAAAVGGSSDATAPIADTGAGLQGASSFPSVAETVPGATATGPTSVSPPPVATPPANAGGGVFVPAVSSGPEKATPALVVLLVVGALGGAVLWLYAGRQRADIPLSRPAPG